MAETFNNGDSNAQIRAKLNAAAGEINTNTSKLAGIATGATNDTTAISALQAAQASLSSLVTSFIDSLIGVDGLVKREMLPVIYLDDTTFAGDGITALTPLRVIAVDGEVYTTPDAPTLGVVDDTANTFDWTNNPLFTSLSDYEYTVNGGASYSPVTAKAIAIGDIALASGQVGVRIKAGASRNVSATLFSTASFTSENVTPEAPTIAVVDNDADTFGFTVNPTYPALTEYEYTLNGGSSYAQVTVNPIPIGDVALSAGQVGVRIKSASGRTISTTLYNSIPFTVALTTPATPTAFVTDDTSNTAGWTYSAGYAAANLYEYSVNGGAYSTCSANPQPIGNADIAIGQVLIRVKAGAGNNASGTLANTVAYTLSVITPPAPTGGIVNDTADTFAYTLSTGYVVADHEYSLDGGASWYQALSTTISVGNVAIAIGDLIVRVKAASGRNVSAGLSNTTAFTVTVVDTTVPITSWPLIQNITLTSNNQVTTTNTPTYGRSTSDKKLASGASGYVMATFDTARVGSICLDPDYALATGVAAMSFRIERNSTTNKITAAIDGATFADAVISNGSTVRGRVRGDGTTIYMEYSTDSGATWVVLLSGSQPAVDLYVKTWHTHPSTINNIVGFGLV